MKFIDEATIEVQAGRGGDGCVSFRREKYVPRGGPDGGNGGKGGDIIAMATKNLSTLMDLQYQKRFKAGNARHGQGQLKNGRSGADCEIALPLGTLIIDTNTQEVIADMTQEGERIVLAHGGRGGRGNASFKSSTHQTPTRAGEGHTGEKKILRLELKVLADIGLVGLPNAGKSTLLSVISKAHPKIADYPFTTLNPVLGVVTHKDLAPFTVADIPGLIEGAHQGEGLGHQFLKHIERTRTFVHLVSLSPEEQDDPLTRFDKINYELNAYDSGFSQRPQIVALTKIDLRGDQKELKHIAQQFKDKGYPVVLISSITREGLTDLLDILAKP